MVESSSNTYSMTWERLITLGDTFTARAGHTAIYEPSKKLIYVFGGYTGSEVLNDVSIFDS